MIALAEFLSYSYVWEKMRDQKYFSKIKQRQRPPDYGVQRWLAQQVQGNGETQLQVFRFKKYCSRPKIFLLHQAKAIGARGIFSGDIMQQVLSSVRKVIKRNPNLFMETCLNSHCDINQLIKGTCAFFSLNDEQLKQFRNRKKRYWAGCPATIVMIGSRQK